MVNIKSLRDYGGLSHKCISLPYSFQGSKIIKEGNQKDWKSQRYWRTIAKQCFFGCDTWIKGGCDYVHKIKPDKITAQIGRGLWSPTPRWRTNGNWERESWVSSGMRLLRGYPCSSRQLHHILSGLSGFKNKRAHGTWRDWWWGKGKS